MVDTGRFDTRRCGGCEGLGAHSPKCFTQPGYLWRRYADGLKALAVEIGSNDVRAANQLYALEGEMRDRWVRAVVAHKEPDAPPITDKPSRMSLWLRPPP